MVLAQHRRGGERVIGKDPPPYLEQSPERLLGPLRVAYVVQQHRRGQDHGDGVDDRRIQRLVLGDGADRSRLHVAEVELIDLSVERIAVAEEDVEHAVTVHVAELAAHDAVIAPIRAVDARQLGDVLEARAALVEEEDVPVGVQRK